MVNDDMGNVGSVLDVEDNLDDLVDDGFECDKCGEWFSEDDLTFIDYEYLCDDCLCEYTFICDICDDRHWNEDAMRVRDQTICSVCFSDNYTPCRTCEEAVDNEEAYYIDNECYCYDCYEEASSSLSIKPYSYKPEPIFYKLESSHDDKPKGAPVLYYGIELEVDDGGKDYKNAYALMKIINDSEVEHVYCKHDGSLNDGFEIVSHPMTLEYHKSVAMWENLLEMAHEMGYKSHMTETCGLHVHVGRKELGDTASQQEEVIGRILYFVEKFWDKVLRFSRRSEAQMQRWAGRYGCCKENPSETMKIVKEGNYDRYVCINLLNIDTIEFRVFKGTLIYQTFIATLQFVDEICRAAILLSNEDFECMTWMRFITGIDSISKSELVFYLIERNLFIEGER